MNPNSQQIDELVFNQDTLELLRLLRTHPDPEVRSQVARRLPEIDEVEIVEGLIRSYKLDPDQEVMRSAQQALNKILGETAAKAISAYGDIREDDREYENALIQSQEGTPADDEEDEENYAPLVQNALIDHDLESLQTFLTSSASADLRAQAAEALGELRDGSSYETLIRAVKADPDEFVRKVARQTLDALLNPNTASAAIAAYGDVDLQEYRAKLTIPLAPNITEEIEGEDQSSAGELDIAAGTSDWSPEHTSALASVVSDDRHPEKQIKALNILSMHPTLEGNNAISMAAIWSDNSIVRQHALNILKSIYGEELPAYLEDFEKSFDAQENAGWFAETEDEEEDGQDEEGVLPGEGQPAALPSTHQQEESFSGLQLILFILVVIILLLVARYFLLP